MSVRFILDGERVEIENVDPTGTLLDYLRGRMGRIGTKEGCAEGDCGACTVLVGEREGESLKWRAVNSCILFLPMIHGKALLTVESLARDGALNALQVRMASNGSSQCGFCTPGFVMSLYGRTIGAIGHDLPVEDVIAGNLCRCTGYGPILAAANETGRLERDDGELVAQLVQIAEDGSLSGRFGDRQWHVPRTSEELADILATRPKARLVAGATDVGLWVTKGLRTLDTLVFIGGIADLQTIDESAEGLRIGAGVRYADAHASLAKLHPDLGELSRRLGGLQVRNSGTVGGNIANGSPIGDGPPALIALGATLTLRSAAGQRTIALEDFFLDYGKQDLRTGEFVESVWIPRPDPQDVVLISKLSRRFDSDISAVCGAIKLDLRDGQIARARVAFGGMAATPKRASGCEAALAGRPLSEATIEAAAEALQHDFSPLSDVRGSAQYRHEAAANLLRRLWQREQGVAVSVLEIEGTGNG